MFRTRLLSGILLVAIALGVLLKGGALLALVIFAVSVIAYQELTAASKVRGDGQVPSAPVIAGCVMILVYYAVLGLALGRDIGAVFPAMVLVIAAALLVFLFVYVFTFPKYHANQIMAALFCFLYGPVMLSCVVRVSGILGERHMRLLCGRADRETQDDAEAQPEEVYRGRGRRRTWRSTAVCSLYAFCD